MTEPLRVFIGVDEKQPVALTVCAASVWRNAKQRVSIEPIRMDWMPGFTRRGLTQFTYARYGVPWMCDYRGTAIFMDGDILVHGDVNELAALADPLAAVSVATHLARFEWPSVMVFNNALCDQLTPKYINNPSTNPASLEWAGRIGNLPPKWNHAVLYDEHVEDASLIHFTCGLPGWPETRKSPHAEKWMRELRLATSQCSWQELMGTSVHVERVAALNKGT